MNDSRFMAAAAFVTLVVWIVGWVIGAIWHVRACRENNVQSFRMLRREPETVIGGLLLSTTAFVWIVVGMALLARFAFWGN